MNNIFQLNKAYSNAAFYAKAANDYLYFPRFDTNLYKEASERCPWPKSRAYCQKLIDETKEVFVYFVPVRRTKNFIWFVQNGQNQFRRKIYKDSEGNEFVWMNKTILHASEILKITMEEANEQYLTSLNKLVNKVEFARKLAEVEEYGYTHILKSSYGNDGTLLSNSTRVTTEEELRNFYLPNDSTELNYIIIMNDIEKPFNEVTAEDIKNALTSDVERDTHWGLPVLIIDDEEYAVAEGEEEATKAARQSIEDSICYFRPDFLAAHSDVPEEVFEFLTNKDYSNNDAYIAMIHNLDEFVEDAIDADGRGHFLNPYDSKEYEIGEYFLYRID